MNLFRNLLRKDRPQTSTNAPQVPVVHVRPLTSLATPQGSVSDIAAVMNSPAYTEVRTYFSDYPERSLMSDHSRSVLYCLVRLMQPNLIAEIGTLYAGTTEVLARALWQNGKGKILSADPYGGERCPQIIAQWPSELRHHVEFHAKSSMDFFARMILESKTFDLVLVDGNHDYEFALFDLQMASRLLRPGGIVVMDNAEQVGPFKATIEFLENNPAWRELGDAIATSNPLRPFDRNRASLPGTTFLVLQAPNFYSIGVGPHSWGQTWIDVPRVSGVRLNIVAPTKGILFYQIHLRGFANGNRWVKEERLEDSVRIDVQEREVSIDHRFNQAMVVTAPPEFNDALFTLELDLAWRADPGEPPLALSTLPSPIDQ